MLRVLLFLILLIQTIHFGLFAQQTNTFPQSGSVGIGTTAPRALLDIATYIPDGQLGAVLGRLPEGDATFEGTFLGVRGFTTRFNNQYNAKSFSLEHSFYGKVNSSINFIRGGSYTGGLITFSTNDNTEQMRLDEKGNLMLGIPHWESRARAVLDIAKDISNGQLGAVLGRLPEGDGILDGTYLGVRGFTTQFNNQYNGKSFSLEHSFYGEINSSINFMRGGNKNDGFITFNTRGNVEQMRLDENGNLMLGTISHRGHRLAVDGSIRATEIKIEATSWPDYVFKKDYSLPTLEETAQFIAENGHLPEIPKAADVEEDGVSLGEMNKLLLKKIEELTLHLIEQQKENRDHKKRIMNLEKHLF